MRITFSIIIISLLFFTCTSESASNNNAKDDTTNTASKPSVSKATPKEPTNAETKIDSVVILELFGTIVKESRIALKTGDFSKVAPYIASRNLKEVADLSKGNGAKIVEHFCNQIADAIPDNCPIKINNVITGTVPEGEYASFQITCGGNPIPCGFIKVDGKYLYAGLSNE